MSRDDADKAFKVAMFSVSTLVAAVGGIAIWLLSSITTQVGTAGDSLQRLDVGIAVLRADLKSIEARLRKVEEQMDEDK